MSTRQGNYNPYPQAWRDEYERDVMCERLAARLKAIQRESYENSLRLALGVSREPQGQPAAEPVTVDVTARSEG
jgi:hypothetical protein